MQLKADICFCRWGIVEHAGPQQYDFSAYERLFETAAQAGLKIQAVMSFHAAGGNVGDTCKINLPAWVTEVGDSNPDIYYTDKQGFRNKECLSLGCDLEPLFWGRSPVDMYRDFISAFADTFDHLAGMVQSQSQHSNSVCCCTNKQGLAPLR